MKRFSLPGIALLCTPLVLGACASDGLGNYSYTEGEKLSEEIVLVEGYVQKSKEYRSREEDPPEGGWDRHIEGFEERLRILRNSRAAYEERRDRDYDNLESQE